MTLKGPSKSLSYTHSYSLFPSILTVLFFLFSVCCPFASSVGRFLFLPVAFAVGTAAAAGGSLGSGAAAAAATAGSSAANSA